MNQKKILVVDDDELTLKFISFKLNEAGYKVKTAMECLGALQHLKYDVPDMIVLDIMLPDLSGFELLNIIRVDKLYSELPVILISVHSENEIIHAASKLGATDFVSKSIDIDLLLEKIKNSINVLNSH